MANEIRSQIATKQGVPLSEALLRDASNSPPVSLSSVIQPNIPTCLYANPNNGLQIPVAIGATQLQDNTYGMNVRASIRDEGILKFGYLNLTPAGGAAWTGGNFTVPAGKIWLLKNVNIAGSSLGGGSTITTCQVLLESYAGASDDHPLYSVADASTFPKMLTTPIYLTEGQTVFMRSYFSVYGSGTLKLYLLYQEFNA